MPSSRPPSRTPKRSTTNLSDLRLAPLSSRHEPPPPTASFSSNPRTPDEKMDYTRHHPSYMSGASAPTTPGILSRSGSRRYLSGGLSRRGSLYDDGMEEGEGEGGGLVYPTSRNGMGGQGEIGKVGMVKAKSEAALSSRLAGQGVPLRRPREGYTSTRKKSRTDGTNALRPSRRQYGEEDWFSRANATANAMLRESKGQGWMEAGAAGVAESSEDDEGYEEMAAASLTTDDAARRPNMHRWGSRYGSRSASRRTSRRGSVVGAKTPLATGEGGMGYFDNIGPVVQLDSEVTKEEREDSGGEAEMEQLTRNRSMGFGGIVDRVVGFSLFGAAESEESGGETGTETEGKDSASRKRTAPPPAAPPAPSSRGEKVGIWEDAAWLLSVAGRALTQ